MIYYKYIFSYINPRGLTCSIRLIKSSDNEDNYQNEISETKAFAILQATANDGVYPDEYIEELTQITEEEYNAHVSIPDNTDEENEDLFPETDE